MNPRELVLLRCPACRGRLDCASVQARTETGEVRDGVLACSGCGERYPVLDWIARLVPPRLLRETERSVLRQDAGPAPQIVPPEEPDADELRAALDEKARAKIFHAGLPPGLEEQAQRDYEYRARHTEEKMKFVRTAAPLLRGELNTIVDVGGGQGGTLSAFRAAYQPGHAFLVDLDPEWLEVARLRDRATEVVRGDATRLPFSDQSIDLLITTATLEHIPDWRGALREFLRVARQGLVCYGPNGSFPYDFGHVDAPFVTWLPKPAAARVAASYHRLRGTGRTIDTVRHQLESTFYIPRAQAVRELERSGAEATNVFREFLEESVRDEYHLHGRRVLRVLRQHPRLRRAFSGVLTAIGMEPNVYIFFQAPERAEEVEVKAATGAVPARPAGAADPR
jgi:ubiquinone/menaquinone biosynthesis C-methylase UbiE/uncharacterized protein YbaR (Trm112 family)